MTFEEAVARWYGGLRAPPFEPPRSVRGLAALAGGRRHGTRELARLTGKSQRTIQRWIVYEEGGAAQKRKPDAGALARVSAMFRRPGRDDRPTLRRRGARMRLTALVPTTSPSAAGRIVYRLRIMPAGGPGVPLYPAEMSGVLDLLDAGENDEGAAMLLDHFAGRYGFIELPEVIGDVEALAIWPEGERAP